MKNLRAVGKIRTSYGIKGEIKFFSYSGTYTHFDAIKEVLLKKGAIEKTVRIEAIRWSGNQPLLKIEGVDLLEEAKAFSNFEIWVHKDQAAPLQEGEYYLGELVGCSLVFEDQIVATITSFLEGGSTELLEARKADGTTVVIPFMNRYLGEIDLMNRTIELKTQWLLE